MVRTRGRYRFLEGPKWTTVTVILARAAGGFSHVDGVSLKSVLVTLSHPYRRLASLRGDDQGDIAGPFAPKVVVLLR